MILQIQKIRILRTFNLMIKVRQGWSLRKWLNRMWSVTKYDMEENLEKRFSLSNGSYSKFMITTLGKGEEYYKLDLAIINTNYDFILYNLDMTQHEYFRLKSREYNKLYYEVVND